MMPYFENGNLEDSHKRNPFTTKDITDILFQTLTALGHLHSFGVMHRDLGPRNILVESRNPIRIKIADFGLAKNNPVGITVCGTPVYRAPEVETGNYGNSVDIWSLAVVALQFAQGPVGGHGWPIADGIIHQATTMSPSSLRDLLCAMLQMAPWNRPTALACLEFGHTLGLFERHQAVRTNFRSSATPTPQGSPELEIQGNNGSSLLSPGQEASPTHQPCTGGGLGVQSNTRKRQQSVSAEDSTRSRKRLHLDSEEPSSRYARFCALLVLN
jgi:serine/threonine protein kinase